MNIEEYVEYKVHTLLWFYFYENSRKSFSPLAHWTVSELLKTNDKHGFIVVKHALTYFEKYGGQMFRILSCLIAFYPDKEPEIPREAWGKYGELREIWLDWGREEGLL